MEAPRCLACDKPVRRLRLVVDGQNPRLVANPCGHREGVEFTPEDDIDQAA